MGFPTLRLLRVGHRSGQDFLLLLGDSAWTLVMPSDAVEHRQEGSGFHQQRQLPSILLPNACPPFSYHRRGGADGPSGAFVF